MSEISELMASNDPMATPVMSLGPSPPVNTTPQMQHVETSHASTIQEGITPVYNTHASQPQMTKRSGKLTTEQRLAIVVGCCVFLVFLPNIQQLILSQLPVLNNNATALLLTNSALVAGLFFLMRDRMVELI